MTDSHSHRDRAPKFTSFTSRKRPRDKAELERAPDSRRHSYKRRDEYDAGPNASSAKPRSGQPTSRPTHYRQNGEPQPPRPRSDSPSRRSGMSKWSRGEMSRREFRKAHARQRQLPQEPRHSHHSADHIPTTNSPSPPVRDSADFFVIDTTGDADNVKYGGISKWSVPKYHLAGGGSVLGLDPSLMMDWIASTTEGYVLKRRPNSSARSLPSPAIDDDDLEISRVESDQGDDGSVHDEEFKKVDEDEVVRAFEGMGEGRQNVSATQTSY